MVKNDSEIIIAKNLTAAYGDRPIWTGADFSVRSGEFVAVVGPNGAGKTTLFRLLLGLAAPAGGTLKVFGEEAHRGSARIGYIPQRHQIDSYSRVAACEFLRLGLDGHRWGFSWGGPDLARVRAILKTVGAADLATRPLGALSGGELQRIFLAQALIGQPELLLLDEPLANLDMKREADFVRLIKEVVKAQGVTALLITHNINPLLPVLDRVIYLANGRVTTGRPEEVLTSATLSRIYDIPVEVLRDSQGRLAIIGIEETTHHHYD